MSHNTSLLTFMRLCSAGVRPVMWPITWGFQHFFCKKYSVKNGFWQTTFATCLGVCVIFLEGWCVSWPGCVSIFPWHSELLCSTFRWYGKIWCLTFLGACNWDTQMGTYLPRVIGTDTRYDTQDICNVNVKIYMWL